MKRVALFAVGAALFSAPAAADQPVYQWSGLYVGGQAGYAMVNGRWPDIIYSDGITQNFGAEGFGGGVFAGYNHVGGNWLIGGEAEANVSDLEQQFGSSSLGPLYLQDWSAGARLRLGFLASLSSLFYASVGATVAHFDYTKGVYSYPKPDTMPETYYGSLDQVLTGLQLGAGIEAFVTPQLSVRVEADFTHYSDGIIHYYKRPEDSSTYADTPFRLSPDTLVARVGVAYHPGWLGQSQTGTEQPIRQSWQGFYAGADSGVSMLNSFEDFDPRVHAPLRPYYTFVNGAVMGGAHAGYNWQSGRLVAGVEVSGEGPLSELGTGSGERETWSAAVRGRLGIVTADNVLFYGALGWAVGGFDYSGLFPSSSGFPNYLGNIFTKQGIQIGAGTEAFLSPHLSASVEGVYTVYGSQDIYLEGSVPPYPNIVVTPHTLEGRVGVAYHFN
ncbi:MAG: outer membrane beta-barrel protein [Bauldia sp.]